MNTENSVAQTTDDSTQKVLVEKKGRGRPKIHTDVPSHLTCSVSGVKVKTTPVQFRKQLQKSGKDIDTFLSTYISSLGKRQLKEKVKAEKLAKQSNESNESNVAIPEENTENIQQTEQSTQQAGE